MAKPTSPSLNTSHSLASGLVRCYVPTESSGATVADLTANADKLTLSSSAMWATANSEPVLRFTGSQTAQSAANLGITGDDARTIAVLMSYPGTGSNNQQIAALGGSSTGTAYRLFMGGGGRLNVALVGNAGSSNLTADSNVRLVAATHDGTATLSGGTLYLGGTSGGSGTSEALSGSATVGTTDSNIELGNSGLAADIHAVYVWNRELSETELNQLNADPYVFVTPAASSVSITLTRPRTKEVRQREVNDRGTLRIAGTYTGSPTAIEARYQGGPWITIDASPSGGTFDAVLGGQPVGRGTLEVREVDNAASVQSVADVAIGDVVLAWGQSNADGRATNFQAVGHPSIVATHFRGGVWSDADDPIRSDNTKGSIWPRVLRYVIDETEVPLGLIHAAQGGTGLVSDSGQWSVGGTLQTAFEAQVVAADTSGAVAVITWQGERDAQQGTSRADYMAAYVAVAERYAATFNAPTICIQVQTSPGGGSSNPHGAQSDAFAQSPFVVGLVRTEELVFADDLHATTDAQVEDVAWRMSRELRNLLPGSSTIELPATIPAGWVTSIVSGVWQATTRTLTAFGFTVNTNGGDATEAKQDQALAKLDNIAAGPIVRPPDVYDAKRKTIRLIAGNDYTGPGNDPIPVPVPRTERTLATGNTIRAGFGYEGGTTVQVTGSVANAGQENQLILIPLAVDNVNAVKAAIDAKGMDFAEYDIEVESEPGKPQTIEWGRVYVNNRIASGGS